jgi:hypothetical protein
MQFPAIIVEPSTSSTSYQTSKPALTHDVLEKGAFPPSGTPVSQNLKLWGLSLGMTLDLTAYMIPAPSSKLLSNGKYHPRTPSPMSAQLQLPYQSGGEDGMRMGVVSPSLASVFPRFSYPDVNFWIWVFGKRYREVVRGWEASVRAGGANDRRINWSGSALSTFYAAIRKALVVVIVARALGVLFGLAFAGWWVFSM